MREFRNLLGVQNPRKPTESRLGLQFCSFAVAYQFCREQAYTHH